MIRKICLFIYLILFSSYANAASNIAFVDINYIIEKSNSGLQITEILKKKRDKESKRLEAKKNEIKKNMMSLRAKEIF